MTSYLKGIIKTRILDTFTNRDDKQADLANQEYTITDERLLTDYPSSPTGRAYIGVSKKPLQEVKDGHGYMGVLLQTDNRQFVQCHVCGKWAKRLTDHIKSAHKLTKVEYTKKFGLYTKNALVADASSYKLSVAGYKAIRVMTPETRRKRITNLKIKQKSGSRKMIGKTEHDNKFGLCEKQLGFRLVEYLKTYQDLPSIHQKGEGTFISGALKKRYVSLNLGFKHYGLPTRHRYGGTKVELIAPDGQQYFFNYRTWNKEEVYQWMVEHSPVLQGDVNQFAD